MTGFIFFSAGCKVYDYNISAHGEFKQLFSVRNITKIFTSSILYDKNLFLQKKNWNSITDIYVLPYFMVFLKKVYDILGLDLNQVVLQCKNSVTSYLAAIYLNW